MVNQEESKIGGEGEARCALERTSSKLVCSIFQFMYSFNQQLFMTTCLYTRHWAGLSDYGVNRTDMISVLTKLTVHREGQASEK